ncbi:Poly [ADP-ribose] polymerase 6 [Tritrichomonas musculus]|uniref:Poly [ADP-ribose] polymerase 6 n=1 Tax=Tritrichomonas musculus TaxID=1915356 RepID=A0ABR2J0U1_9EUKA
MDGSYGNTDDQFTEQTLEVLSQHSYDPDNPPIEVNPDEIPRDSLLYSWLCQYMYGIITDTNNNRFPVSLSIPRTVLPISLQILYNFDISDDMLKITIDRSPTGSNQEYKIKAEQPIIGESFTGSSLVNTVITDFQNGNYKPKEYYRSSPFILYKQNAQPSPEKVQKMVEAGYDELQSEKALSNCHDDLEKSIHLLRTGEYEFPKEEMKVSDIVKYDENPLIYLILGIVDKIFDLQDHCSICGDPIQRSLKPTSCEKNICYTQFSSIGLGTSVIQEIKRDIKVADLLFSVFVSSIGTKFLIPAPPPLTTEKLNERIDLDEMPKYKSNDGKDDLNYDPNYLMEVVKKVPSFDQIVKEANDDSLRKSIGREAFKLLQWVLLTNRAQLFWLPPPLELQLIKNASPNCIQFMSLASSPEQESIFQQLKEKFGSLYLWHGSGIDKWHSIIRNGLINTSRVKGMVVHGTAYGEGIYLASHSDISMSYVNKTNAWSRSSLGQISIIALCEVIKFPFNQDQKIEVNVKNKYTGQMEKKVLTGRLNSFTDIFTLTMEEAIIVRFLFVNFNGRLDILNNQPTGIPTFDDFINYHMQKK